jgi:hypothetical protein
MKPFGPGCPWYQMQQDWGLPNIKWCEETICALINEPSNAWTNISYFLTTFIIFMARNKDGNKGYSLYFAFLTFVVGLSSFVYHATNNLFTQFFDFVGMFFFCSFLIALNLRRLQWVGPKTFGLSFLSIAGLLHGIWFLYQHNDWKYQILVFYCILALVVTEILIAVRIRPLISRKFFIWTLVVFAIAQAFSLIDGNRVWCHPEHPIHGHGVWHLLSGLGMYLTYRYYQSFQFFENKAHIRET